MENRGAGIISYKQHREMFPRNFSGRSIVIIISTSNDTIIAFWNAGNSYFNSMKNFKKSNYKGSVIVILLGLFQQEFWKLEFMLSNLRKKINSTLKFYNISAH